MGIRLVTPEQCMEAVQRNNGDKRVAAQELGIAVRTLRDNLHGWQYKAEVTPLTMPKILTLDLETAPIVGYVWGLREQNLSIDMIVEPWSVLCFCAKWIDSDDIISGNTGGRGKQNVRDDTALMRQLWDLLNEADIVIAQNGKAFDIKMLNGRMIQQGLKPYSPIRIIDTLLAARDRFRFPSNKLAFQSKVLTDTPKSEHKRFPGFELWTEVLADNPEAWDEMLAYCETDVRATEKVYHKQLPWIRRHPNLGAYLEDKNPRCTNCASDKLENDGYETTQQGKFDRLLCTSCGTWNRGKQQQLAHNVRKNLLVGV